MGLKPGNSSLQVPPRAPIDYGTHALVAIGIMVSCVFIGGSALLNYRMGFSSTDNATDGTIYGSLAAAGDGLKALSPFVAAYGWRHRDWLATLAATVVFVTFTAYSFTSALGFSSQHRATKEGNAVALMERHQDARDALARDRRELDALGPQRSRAELGQAITNQLRAPLASGRWTVEEVSEGCAKNKPVTREACAKIAALKLEAARADKAERLADDIRSLTRSQAQAPIIQSADPQSDALKFLGHLLHLLPREGNARATQNPETGFGLALLMALFIELGSGLGLYIATTPWRAQATGSDLTSEPLPAPLPVKTGLPLETFMAERLEWRDGQELYLTVVFEVYKEWCQLRHKPAQRRTRFERGFLKVAKEVGLEADFAHSGWVIRNVALRTKALPYRQIHG